MAVQQLTGYKPLCYIKETLYLYRKGFIYRSAENHLEKVIQVYPSTAKESLRVLARLFRAEPKYAVPINESQMLLVGHRTIKVVDVEKHIVKDISSSREGFSDPLNICDGREKWVALWGDYGPNTEHDIVNIYGLTKDSKVETVFSFESGQVRHIHNIIPKLSGGYYVFTGDQEKRAGIYKTNAAFDQVEPVKIGQQQYRAVVGFDTPKGLLYATDAVNEKNYVYLLDGKGEPKKICALNGSCIYGTEFKGKYYLSTTVEPDENNRGVTSWISSKRGEGILSDEVYLIEIDDEMSFKKIEKFKKDSLPMKLMQYGAIHFPRGKMEELWCYPVAVKKYDGKALLIQMD